ncbi:SRPBCC family protein [Georgenia halophila]|uniref:SRPBCC family protein n=1 Tax=Georgenia halophila TaxID=620889 RepID=A0ABP8LCF3_9MICO
MDRRVGNRVIPSGEARTVVLSTAYTAAIEDVWDACTNPERLPRWFLPVSGDLRLGGTYQFEGNAGGTIESCDPPHSFGATWEFMGGMSWIEVRLEAEAPDRTRLTLEHIATEDDHWKRFGPGAVGIGWDLGLMGLALHLHSGNGLAEFDEEAWSASDEGKEFVRRSGEGWFQADVASGTDESVARERADKTIAFFSGEVPTEEG